MDYTQSNKDKKHEVAGKMKFPMNGGKKFLGGTTMNVRGNGGMKPKLNGENTGAKGGMKPIQNGKGSGYAKGMKPTQSNKTHAFSSTYSQNGK